MQSADHWLVEEPVKDTVRRTETSQRLCREDGRENGREEREDNGNEKRMRL